MKPIISDMSYVAGEEHQFVGFGALNQPSHQSQPSLRSPESGRTSSMEDSSMRRGASADRSP